MVISQCNQTESYPIAAKLACHDLNPTAAPMKLKTISIFLVFGLVQKLAWAALGITKGKSGMLRDEIMISDFY